MPFDIMERYLPILCGASLLWVAAWVVASIVYRRRHGKPIVVRRVAEATFAEDTASGRSNRTWFTKLGGASRCLIVAVAGSRLIIRPRFPFNLMFLPEVYGLEYDVPTDQVTLVDWTPGQSGPIRLEFHDSSHALHDVTLYLRNPAEFVRALGKHVT